MGAAYKELGESAKAIDYYQQSLLVAQEIQSRDGEWKALNNLSIVYTSLKDYTKAIEYQQKVLAIAKALQDRDLEWTALSALASSYNSLKDYQYDSQVKKSWKVKKFKLTIGNFLRQQVGFESRNLF